MTWVLGKHPMTTVCSLAPNAVVETEELKKVANAFNSSSHQCSVQVAVIGGLKYDKRLISLAGEYNTALGLSGGIRHALSTADMPTVGASISYICQFKFSNNR